MKNSLSTKMNASPILLQGGTTAFAGKGCTRLSRRTQGPTASSHDAKGVPGITAQEIAGIGEIDTQG